MEYLYARHPHLLSCYYEPTTLPKPQKSLLYSTNNHVIHSLPRTLLITDVLEKTTIQEPFPSIPLDMITINENLSTILSFSHLSFLDSSRETPLLTYHLTLTEEWTHISSDSQKILFSNTFDKYKNRNTICQLDIQSDTHSYLNTTIAGNSRFVYDQNMKSLLFAYNSNQIFTYDTRTSHENLILNDKDIQCFDQCDTQPTQFLYSTMSHIHLMDKRYPKLPILTWKDCQNPHNPFTKLQFKRIRGESVIFAMNSTELLAFHFQPSNNIDSLDAHPVYPHKADDGIRLCHAPRSFDPPRYETIPKEARKLYRDKQELFTDFDIQIIGEQMRILSLTSDNEIYRATIDVNDLLQNKPDLELDLIFHHLEDPVPDSQKQQTRMIDVGHIIRLFQQVLENTGIDTDSDEIDDIELMLEKEETEKEKFQTFASDKGHFSLFSYFKSLRPYQLNQVDGNLIVKNQVDPKSLLSNRHVLERSPCDLSNHLKEAFDVDVKEFQKSGIGYEVALAAQTYNPIIKPSENMPEFAKSLLAEWDHPKFELHEVNRRKKKKKRDVVRAWEEEKMELSQANMQSFMSTAAFAEDASRPLIKVSESQQAPRTPSVMNRSMSQPSRLGPNVSRMSMSQPGTPHPNTKKRKKGF